MGISDKSWDGSPSNWPDTASYCDSCAINQNTGPREEWVQAKCKLPYTFPNGDISTVSIASCAAALAGARGGITGVSPAEKKQAAKTLMKAYGEAKMDPPASLKNLAQ